MHATLCTAELQPLSCYISCNCCLRIWNGKNFLLTFPEPNFSPSELKRSYHHTHPRVLTTSTPSRYHHLTAVPVQGLKLQHLSQHLNCDALSPPIITTNLFSPKLQHLSHRLNCNALSPPIITTNLFSPKLQHLSHRLNCNTFTTAYTTTNSFLA